MRALSLARNTRPVTVFLTGTFIRDQLTFPNFSVLCSGLSSCIFSSTKNTGSPIWSSSLISSSHRVSSARANKQNIYVLFVGPRRHHSVSSDWSLTDILFLYESICESLYQLKLKWSDGYCYLTRCIPQDQCETQKVFHSTLGFCCWTRILFFGQFLLTLESSSSNMDLEYRLWSKKHKHCYAMDSMTKQKVWREYCLLFRDRIGFTFLRSVIGLLENLASYSQPNRGKCRTI